METVEALSTEALASKWVQTDLIGPGELRTEQRACPWRFQQSNSKCLRVEDRQRAQYQLQLHRCDESTDQVLKETFFPVLKKFREVQVGLATLASRRHESDKDPELVIAVLLRRPRTSEEALISLNNLVSAYRQLSLSPYVQQYMGTEDVVEGNQKVVDVGAVTTRYYFEFVQARTLSEVILEEGRFEEQSAVFKLYAREVLLAMIDVLEQSTHDIYTRLSPEHVMVSHSGRRLFLGKLDFGDYISPTQGSPNQVIRTREQMLLQDLSVILFAMLYPVTLPRNLADFRTQYLGCRDSQFVFRYRVDCTSPRSSSEAQICVSCGDIFAVVLGNDTLFDAIWNCQVSNSKVLTCIDRCYSPMKFTFAVKAHGECAIVFSPLGNGVSSSFSVVVNATSTNFRLQPSRAQTLISQCANPSSLLSLRMLLHHHEYFQPLNDVENHEAERELLERV